MINQNREKIFDIIKVTGIYHCSDTPVRSAVCAVNLGSAVISNEVNEKMATKINWARNFNLRRQSQPAKTTTRSFGKSITVENVMDKHGLIK